MLLIGGSSRIPLVAQLVSAELGRSVTVHADPQVAIALGAALGGRPADTAYWADTADRADTDPTGAGVKPDTPVPTTIRTAGLAGSAVSEPAQPEIPNRPSLTAIPLDVESADDQWCPARPRRFKQFAAAGVLVLLGGTASVLYVTSHSGPISPAVAVPPAPATPVTTVRAPNPGSGNDSPSGDFTETVHPTPPAAPSKPAVRPVKPKQTAVRELQTTRVTRDSRPTSRSKPSASPTPSPRAPIPAWVEAARNG